MAETKCYHSFLLSYEYYGIRWNLYVIARNWNEAKLKAPKGARNINAEWLP